MWPTFPKTPSFRSPAFLCVGPLCLDELVFDAGGLEQCYPGGNAVISASVLAATGVATAVAGQVGDDAAGAAIRRLLELHGVDTSRLRVAPALSTKVSRNAVLDDGGWRRLSVTPERFPYLRDEPHDVSGFSHLYVGGLNGLMRAAPDATRELVSSCRRQGLAIGFGLASGRFDRGAFQRLIADRDLVFGTAHELHRLLRTATDRPRDVLRALVDSRFEHGLATFGPAGALLKWCGGRYFRVDASGAVGSEIDPGDASAIEIFAPSRETGWLRQRAVSTVGAGDTLAAVFQAAIATGRDAPTALRLAARAAWLSVADATWDGWLSRISTPPLAALSSTLEDWPYAAGISAGERAERAVEHRHPG